MNNTIEVFRHMVWEEYQTDYYSKETRNAVDEALLALKHLEKLKKHLWENYGYDEDIPVEEVLKIIGEVKK